MHSSVEEILGKLGELLEDHVPEDSALEEDTDLINALGLDSTVVIDIVLDLEDEFEVSVSMNELTDIRTAGELARLIRRLQEDDQ